ncbi:carboxypeptidase-like regulatory domain-containing protein [Larkinella humicola]|uniref:Carboxypeptidase regulatory-like domain-containing protein n=1 Tax=Larkinella humicola TaxID=2607654 RepID=A0A5N1JK41_9BACT|nr:carboxypeptidase-like regulatory domain-containing protein [Larkinella humicola]KAA9356471.1 carboxypeptidase regulatory-like domain-containing protein [Larkinella humicola]
MNTPPILRGWTRTALLLAGSLTFLTACKTDSTEPEPGSPSETGGKAGYVIGKVTDPQGKPLPRATVYIDNTVIKGRGAEVASNSDGTYQIQLMKDLGQWVTKGYILKQYNNRVYKLLLDPENPDSFSETEKPVRNFQWKLTGHIPDLSLDLYYGGTAELFRDPNVTDLPDTENIEFTFKPIGTLIDGSTGKTLKLRVAKRTNDFLKDIPMGRYEVSAVYKPTGATLLVTDAWGDDLIYKPVVTLDFLGTDSATRSNTLGIGYTNRR